MTNAVTKPLDVKLMNTGALVLVWVFVVLCVWTAVRWVSRMHRFDIAVITVTGETSHNNVAGLRANVMKRMDGTFFTVDLAQVRSVFEDVPWVRKAVVRRAFPNRLLVNLEEHRAVAFWGTEGELRLLNSFGEVFEANVGEVEQDSLVVLNGPDGQGSEVYAMYKALAPLFERMDMPIAQLELSGRGRWSVQLDSDAGIALGQGSVAEVVARVQRFLKTLTQVANQYGRGVDALEYADLRHENGYAIRLRGVSTVAADGPKSNARSR